MPLIYLDAYATSHHRFLVHLTVQNITIPQHYITVQHMLFLGILAIFGGPDFEILGSSPVLTTKLELFHGRPYS